MISKFLIWLGKVRWENLRKKIYGKPYNLSLQDWVDIGEILKKGNYVILTRRKAHLSTYLTNFAHFLLTFRWGYYSHACVNVEPNNISNIDEIMIYESIGTGTKISNFNKVFDCDSVCILKPVWGNDFDWSDTVQNLYKDLGKPYDGSFDLGNPDKVSCVEYILNSLRKHPNYMEIFYPLERMIEIEGNLSPDMFYESGAFRLVYEKRT